MIRTADGCRLWTATTGTGPPTLFLHGGPGLWDTLGGLAGLIDDVTQVHRWDQRGCGRSEGSGPYSIAKTIADIDEIRQHVGHSRITLLGHSAGANLALHYALAHPDRVDKLVYIAGTGLGFAYVPEYRRRRAEVLAPHRERLDVLNAKERTPAEDRELLLLGLSVGFANRATAYENADRMTTPAYAVNRECADAITAEMKQLGEPRRIADCRQLRTPTLIVHGTEDLRAPSVTDTLFDALPDVRRVLIDGAAHYPWVENPNAVKAAIREFLS
jgi:proline iminopeptidase